MMTERPALNPLLSLTFSELRGDVDRLLRSNWAEAPRGRAQQILRTLVEVCECQGFEALGILSRSFLALTTLPRGEALSLRPALDEKLEELLDTAARLLREGTRRRTA